jgi:Na+/H+-dicarboxylate symporter
MFTFYLGTSLIAILVGLFFVNILHPGSSIQPETLTSHVDIGVWSSIFKIKKAIAFQTFFCRSSFQHRRYFFSRPDARAYLF